MPLVARLFLAITRKVARTTPQIARSATTIGMTIIAMSVAVVPDRRSAWKKKKIVVKILKSKKGSKK